MVQTIDSSEDKTEAEACEHGRHKEPPHEPHGKVEALLERKDDGADGCAKRTRDAGPKPNRHHVAHLKLVDNAFCRQAADACPNLSADCEHRSLAADCHWTGRHQCETKDLGQKLLWSEALCVCVCVFVGCDNNGGCLLESVCVGILSQTWLTTMPLR